MSTAIEVDERTASSASDALRGKRLRWLEALESDEWQQGQSCLVQQVINTDRQVVAESQSFCCLGVAREVLSPGWAASLGETSTNNPLDYNRVRDGYDIGQRLEDYLINLNDERRGDFRFIARFLRKVWGLTDVTAGTDVR